MIFIHRRQICGLIIIAAISCGKLLLWAQDSKSAILEQVAAKYRSAVTFRIGFTVRQGTVKSKNYTENRGTFFLGTGERFRVNFPEQEIIWDGRWLWTRDPVNRQMIVEEFNPRSSLKLISDILNGSVTGYQVIKTSRSGDQTVVELNPKKTDGYIRSMRLKIDNK